MFKWIFAFFPKRTRQYQDAISLKISWGHWFVLFNTIPVLFIASRYAFNSDWPNTLFGKLYFFISLFGHFSFIPFAIYLIFLFPLSFLIKSQQVFSAIAIAIASIGLTLLLWDTEIFKQFYLHFSPLAWELLIKTGNKPLSSNLWLWLPIPILLLLEIIFSYWCWRYLRMLNRQNWHKVISLFFIASFIATHLLYAWSDINLYRPITAQKSNYPLSYPMTVRTFLEKHNLLDSEIFNQQLKENGRLDSFYLNYPKIKLKFKTSAVRPNIIILNLSGLSPTMINSAQMPHLSQIAMQFQQSTHHFSSGNSKSAGLVGLFYSLSGKYVDAILGEKKVSPWIKALEINNYQLGLFSAQNFDEPIYHQALFNQLKLHQSKNNASTLTEWKNWLTTHRLSPFFNYLELDSAEVRILDDQINTIWQTLQEYTMLSDTIVIITADIAKGAVTDNPFSFNQIAVPLLIYGESLPPISTTFSSHLDIMPTLLTYLDFIENPIQNYAQGRSLFVSDERKWLLSSNYRWNVAILENGEQYQIDGKGNIAHFDAEDGKQRISHPPLALILQLIQHNNQFVEH